MCINILHKPYKNLRFPGTSIGDCDLKELKSLLETLNIDIGSLSVKPQRDGTKTFPAVEFMPEDLDVLMPAGAIGTPMLPGDMEGMEEDDGDTNGGEEMMQLAPEVQMFLGNHFLADNEAGGSNGNGKASDDDSKVLKDDEQSNDSSSMIEQSMQRHKEMARQQYQNGRANEAAQVSSQALTNGLNALQQAQRMQQFQQQQQDVRGGDEGSNYNCRLCGKVAGNGASLFAHLLYPHYAHLWREDVPHRAVRYDCKECSYSTVKRQHFIMHVARVHDELRKKLAALGENLEVLDNLTQKSQNSNERIVSTVAKGVNESGNNTMDGDSMNSFDGAGGMMSAMADGTPNAKDFFEALARGGGTAAAAAAAGSPGMPPIGPELTPQKMFGFDPSLQGRMSQRGVKPFVKCRLCGKSWKGKDNFFTHLVSTHFKYLWAKEVPKQADMFHCHVKGCVYQSKYRYNFLFHLAGKHKQLKQKLAEEGIPQNVLVPIETDGSEFEGNGDGGAAAQALLAGMMGQNNLMNQGKMLMQQQRMMTTPPSAVKTAGRPPSSSNNTRLICRVCSKVSLNHTCHRQHVVGKHFHEFWAHLRADHMGIFNCHHVECPYKTPNRSVFIIHLAYVHQELKTKLVASGKDPTCATPDVYGKRKYRRAYYDNTQHMNTSFSPSAAGSEVAGVAAAVAALQQQQQLQQQMQQMQQNQPSTSQEASGANAAAAAAADVSYKCTVCKNQFGRRRAVIEHLALSHFHHVWEENSGGLFAVASSGPHSCMHCSFRVTSRQAFICHLVSEHDALKHVLAVQFEGQKTLEDLIETESASPTQDPQSENGFAEEDDEEVEGEEEEEEDEDGMMEGMEEDDEGMPPPVSIEMSSDVSSNQAW